MFDKIVLGGVMLLANAPVLAAFVSIAFTSGVLYGAYKLLSWFIPLLYHLF
jgi:hypothetical protein